MELLCFMETKIFRKEDGWILLQLVEENLGRIEIRYVWLEEIFVNSNVNNLKIITTLLFY